MSEQRRIELERKKAQLALIRQRKADEKEEEERRKAKERLRKDENEENSGLAVNGSVSNQTLVLREKMEVVLNQMGIPPFVGTCPTQYNTTGISSTTESVENGISPEDFNNRRKSTLSLSKVSQTNIPPRETVTYCRETQTPQEIIVKKHARRLRQSPVTNPRIRGESLYGSSPQFVYPHLEWDDIDSLSFNHRAESSGTDDDDDSLDASMDTPPSSHLPGRAGFFHLPSQANRASDIYNMESPSVKPSVIPPTVRELTNEEQRKILVSNDFNQFLNRASRIMERALSETVDIFTRYDEGLDAGTNRALAEVGQVKLERTFFDERWTKHRSVTSMDWSPQYNELLLASYDNNTESPSEPDGVVLIWNTKYQRTSPEYIFHCQSPVTSACFARFHPNLIVGGTYSGTIVVWDNRSYAGVPVLKTQLSTHPKVHTQPVYCMNFVGTQNAHHLASISTDGRMCYWNLDMLSQPQDSLELLQLGTDNNKRELPPPVAPLCGSFPSGDCNNFFVGCENGSIYSGSRHGRAGLHEQYEGHNGPITGIDCHPSYNLDSAPYFLTSSFDWTVKLWSSKRKQPICSFEEFSEYIYDCKWCPSHPSVFATVDGCGRLAVWNLNVDTEIPVSSACVENNYAINHCNWHPSGQRIACGDDSGRVHLFNVSESLALSAADDFLSFTHTVKDLEAEHDDREQDLKLKQQQQKQQQQLQSSSLSPSPMRYEKELSSQLLR